MQCHSFLCKQGMQHKTCMQCLQADVLDCDRPLVACAVTAASIQHNLCMQSILADLLVRLATDHPYHVLYQLLALAKGNRDKQGRTVQRTQDTTGEVEYTIDFDKVAAAEAVVRRIASNPTRQALQASIVQANWRMVLVSRVQEAARSI